MDGANVHFSVAEIALLTNAEIILTKGAIQRKLQRLMEGLQDVLVREAYLRKDYAGTEAFRAEPKISRGENYLGLPYTVLDYPRQFDLQNIFAIRCMVWWGNCLSIHLHLAGGPAEAAREGIVAAREQLANNGFCVGVNEDPWQHQFEEDNYLPIAGLSEASFAKHCSALEHLKIGKDWSLRDVHFSIDEWELHWKLLLGICLYE